MQKCKICGREFIKSSSKLNHEKNCDGSGLTKKEKQALRKRGGIYAKGKIYEEIYGDRAQEMKNIRSLGLKKVNGSPLTEEGKKKKIEKLKKYGGLRKGGGRGKHGWYKGIWCDSSWELAWVIYHIDHNINFKRNIQGFEYRFNNENHKYYPDFILDAEEYIEIKGYLTEQVKEKIKQFPYKLKVITQDNMNLYLNYVKEKYGNNFIRLYGE